MNKDLNLIKEDIIKYGDILCTLGSKVRQEILILLLLNCKDGGIGVNDISDSLNLSRPCISHHLKVLLDSGIVSIEKSGTKNYYHITGIDKILDLKNFINDIELFMGEL